MNPEARKKLAHSGGWSGAQGLTEDVRYYGRWMRDEAEKRIGHLYPKVKIPPNPPLKKGGAEGGGISGQEATVIAWLWARTVMCPNPACGAEMPLARSFWLSTKKDKQAWIEPVVKRTGGVGVPPAIYFDVKTGKGAPSDGTVNRRGATCIVCSTPVPFDHVRAEGKAGRMGAQLMAIVAEGNRGRVYLSLTEEREAIADRAEPKSVPETDLPEQALGFRVQLYGMTKHRDLFTPRQLVALTTFSDLVAEAREQVLCDTLGAQTFLGARASRSQKIEGCDKAGETPAPPGEAKAYADAVATYLGLGVSKLADATTSLTRWKPSMDQAIATFARQALPMVWDYAESSPFNGAAGDYATTIGTMVRTIATLAAGGPGRAQQLDATTAIDGVTQPLIFTDPPYYDNIGYADLADFFYVWLRRSLEKIYPDLFSTLLTPKAQELVATPYRFAGDKEKAQRFFEAGLGQAFAHMRQVQHPDYPLTVYYAFKQAESGEDDEGANGASGVASTGWETMLEGLVRAGFAVSGTWPMRTEQPSGLRVVEQNALASSIVLVCRPRPDDAPLATRREFVAALKKELPDALKKLQRGNIAPVDLAQASIGPGMAVFSRYAKVLEADGSPMKVRTALQLINQALDEFLAQQEGEYDADTRWALAWFEQFGMAEGTFGEAETLSKAKNTSVKGMEEAWLLRARGGKVRLLKRGELPDNWDPVTDPRLTVWKATQHLLRTLEQKGENAAGDLLRRLGGVGSRQGPGLPAVRHLRAEAVGRRSQGVQQPGGGVATAG